MRIDAHIHLYDPEAGSFSWPAPGTALYRKVAPADFIRAAAPAGVSRAVVVACTTEPEQTELILQTMHDDPAVGAVIGFVEAGSRDFIALYDRYCAYPKFRGFRFVCDGEPDAQAWRNVAHVAGKRANVLEFLGSFAGIARYRELAASHPDIHFIIEHFARMRTDTRTLPPEYRRFLDDMAALGNVYMKASALIPLAGAHPAPIAAEHYTAILEAVYEAFGEERCLFGSDWPLLELNGNYAAAVAITEAFLQGKSGTALDKVMANNAINVYGLQGGNAIE